MGWSLCRSQTWHHNLGQIVEVRTHAMSIHKGDVLYVIEKVISSSTGQCQGTILNREATRCQGSADARRRSTTLSTSIEEKQVFDGNAKWRAALRAPRLARAGRDQSSEDRGTVSRRRLRHDSSDRVETLPGPVRPNLSVIDEHSYWIDAYLRNKTRQHPCRRSGGGDLLGFQLRSTKDREHHGRHHARTRKHTQGLPNVDRSYLGSACARIPVRYQDRTSPRSIVVAGMTAASRLSEEKGNAGGQATRPLQSAGKPALGNQWAHQRGY